MFKRLNSSRIKTWLRVESTMLDKLEYSNDYLSLKIPVIEVVTHKFPSPKARSSAEEGEIPKGSIVKIRAACSIHPSRCTAIVDGAGLNKYGLLTGRTIVHSGVEHNVEFYLELLANTPAEDLYGEHVHISMVE